jgi:hypothetical protein
MRYITFIFLLSICLLTACQDNIKNKPQRSNQMVRQMLDNQQDMAGCDSFVCFSATVIHHGEYFTETNLPAPDIAVLNKDKRYIVIGIGRDRIVLRSSARDTLLLTGERDKHLLKAYRNATSQEIDSVIIIGSLGQGKMVMRYEKEKR